MASVGVEQRARTQFVLGRATACFAGAYVLVTVLASAISIAYDEIVKPPPAAEGASILEAPAFVATVPYHVLVMLVVWPAFAWLYFRRKRAAPLAAQGGETAVLGAFWLTAAMITDYVGFVLAESEWSLTAHELYVVYQPWISLIYASIFAAPWIRYGIARAFASGR